MSDSIQGNEHVILPKGREAVESARSWERCVKNPGHKSFIPLSQFSCRHLPLEWQQDDVIEWINHASSLTVRIRANKTSPARPEDGHYYGASNGGLRVGTGFIWKIRHNIPEESWIMDVETARHVVYDDEEARNTSVDLFYDEEESRSEGRMKSAHGLRVVQKFSHKDWCKFQCTTRDAHAASQIEHHLGKWKHLQEKTKHHSFVDKPNTVVIVSHAHGRHKHVTVGEMKELPLLGAPTLPFNGFSYSAATCPGSSGARVWWLGGNLRAGFNSSWGAIHHCKAGSKKYQPWNDGFIAFYPV